MDDLLHYVRTEIAMDGDDGTTVARLDAFLESYYQTQAAQTADHTASSSRGVNVSTQNLDAPFKEFVWKQLISLPEIKVAVLKRLDPSASTPALALESALETQEDTKESGPDFKAEDSNALDPNANLRNKSLIKAARKDAGKRKRDARISAEQWEFTELSEEELLPATRQSLLDKYGQDDLRLAADPQTAFFALTGSQERHGKLTHFAYQILQAITRGREHGKTVIELGREFDHDQKSLFHFVKSLVELNLIVKLKIVDQGFTTSRCIHRHYLEGSEHWATYMEIETEEALSGRKAEAEADGEDDEDQKYRDGFKMSAEHLSMNQAFVQKRLLAALRRAPGKTIEHSMLLYEIGFEERPPRMETRRFNRIVASMAEAGLIEKVGIGQGRDGGTVNGVRLIEKDSVDGLAGEAEGNVDINDDKPSIAMTIPIEKQIVALVHAAGTAGASIKQIRRHLGDLNGRILETILNRLEKGTLPPHLCDNKIHAEMINIGREKSLCYFTLANFHQRMKDDKLDDIPLLAFTHPEEAGGFSAFENTGSYETPEEFEHFAARMTTSSLEFGRAEKKKKRAKTTKATGANGSTTGKNEQDPDMPKKKGRPRKYPEGTTAAQRAALLKERIAAGLEPPPAKRKKKADKASDGESTPSRPPAKAGKKRKQVESDSAAQPATHTEGTGDLEQQTSVLIGSADRQAAPQAGQDSGTEQSTPMAKGAGTTAEPPRKKVKKEKEDKVKGPRGRPRKYPPGTTKAQAKALLEERRKAEALRETTTSHAGNQTIADGIPSVEAKSTQAEPAVNAVPEKALADGDQAMEDLAAEESQTADPSAVVLKGQEGVTESDAQGAGDASASVAIQAEVAAQPDSDQEGSVTSPKVAAESTNSQKAAVMKRRSSRRTSKIPAVDTKDEASSEEAITEHAKAAPRRSTRARKSLAQREDAPVEQAEPTAVDAEGAPVKVSPAPDLSDLLRTASQAPSLNEVGIPDSTAATAAPQELTQAPGAPPESAAAPAPPDNLPPTTSQPELSDTVKPESDISAGAGQSERPHSLDLPVQSAPAVVGAGASIPSIEGHELDNPVFPPMPEPEQSASAFGPHPMHETSSAVNLLPAMMAKVEPDTTVAKAHGRGTERRNYTVLRRQGEFRDALVEAGGIVEEGLPFVRLWQDFIRQKEGAEPVTPDKRTLQLITSGLLSRDLANRMALQVENLNGKMVMKAIIYLKDLQPDSPEMLAFISNLQSRVQDTGKKTWLPNRKIVEKERRPGETQTDDAKPRTKAALAISHENPRSSFLSNWRVVSQMYGWQYGNIARARTLHLFLVDAIDDANDSTYIVSSDAHTRMFASPFVLLDTPLSIYLKLAACPEYYPELDKYLAETDTSKLLVRDLPPAIATMLGTGRYKSIRRFLDLFDILVRLRLLVPIDLVETPTDVVVYSGEAREPRYFQARDPTNQDNVAYWMLTNQAPVYNFRHKDYESQVILSRVPVQTRSDAEVFWTTLHDNIFSPTEDASLPLITQDYPAVFDGPATLVKTLRNAARWSSEYLLLKPQKYYLKSVVSKKSNPAAYLAKEENIATLAAEVCAPTAVVADFVSRMRNPTKSKLSKSRRTVKSSKRRSKVKSQDLQDVLARKANDAAAEREKVWQGIIARFYKENGEQAGDPEIIEFLHNWFINPNGINARDVNEHLAQMVEDQSSVDLAELSKRQALHAMRNGPPTIGTRSRRPIFPYASVSRSKVLPAPNFIAEVSKRTPASGWSEAEDEQLMDFFVVVATRAEFLKLKFSPEPLKPFFPGCTGKLILERLRRLATNMDQAVYLDALQDAWTELWLKERDTPHLPENAPDSLFNFDLPLHRAYLHSHLDKQAIRAQAMLPKTTLGDRIRLPSAPEDLLLDFNVDFSRNTLVRQDSVKSWDFFWSPVTVAQKQKELSRRTFSASVEDAAVASGEEYDAAYRQAKFSERSRLDPPSAGLLKDATALEKRLAEERELEWPTIPEDGEMLALCTMFSEKMVDISIDTTLTAASRPYSDYRTRKIDDESFENAVTVALSDLYIDREGPIFPAQPMYAAS